MKVMISQPMRNRTEEDIREEGSEYMTTEQQEAIERLSKLVELRKNKTGEIIFDNCLCSTDDLETVIFMLREQDVPTGRAKKKKEIGKIVNDEVCFLNVNFAINILDTSINADIDYNTRLIKNKTKLTKMTEEYLEKIREILCKE